MTKNKLGDLNNHLFEQLERLNDETISEEELKKEILRSKAMASIAQQLVNNTNLMFNAQKHYDEYGRKTPDVLMIDRVQNDKVE